jgi:dihydrofolate reductase
MGRIVVHAFTTLDGVIDASPAEAYQPYMDDETMQETMALLTEVDGQLLGRDTYQHLARAWSPQTGPVADRVNAMPKYVLSRTLASADDWANTTIVGYDEVPELRERLNLVSYGCGRLARDLLRDGLLDELQLWFAPVVAGSGARLFGEPGELVRLRLAATRAFATGVVRSTYVGPRA